MAAAWRLLSRNLFVNRLKQTSFSLVSFWSKPTRDFLFVLEKLELLLKKVTQIIEAIIYLIAQVQVTDRCQSRAGDAVNLPTRRQRQANIDGNSRIDQVWASIKRLSFQGRRSHFRLSLSEFSCEFITTSRRLARLAYKMRHQV